MFISSGQDDRIEILFPAILKMHGTSIYRYDVSENMDMSLPDKIHRPDIKQRNTLLPFYLLTRTELRLAKAILRKISYEHLYHRSSYLISYAAGQNRC